jgi:hypothetical protein
MSRFDSEFRLISDLARGKTSRRTLLQRGWGAALGLGTAAMASLVSLSEQVAPAGRVTTP